RLEAIAARLTSQIRGADEIQYPAIVMDNRTDPEIAPIIEGQNLNFEAWQRKLNSETVLVRQNIDAFRFRAEGYSKQRDAMEVQLQLLRQELQGKETLLAKGLIRSTEIKAVQRAIAEATGQIGRLRSEEHTSELQSRENLVCRLLLEKKK